MKYKASRKDFKGQKILKIGGNKLGDLLQYQYPIAYSVRVEGWACDYYDIEGVIISMGYDPIGLKVDDDIINSYNNKARLITTNGGNYEQRSNAVNLLLIEFINKIRGLL
jgi:hypothetical protein